MSPQDKGALSPREEPKAELLPCPFCGGVGEWQEGDGLMGFKGEYVYIAFCGGDNCDVNPSVSGVRKIEIVAAWNRRATTSRDEALESLRNQGWAVAVHNDYRISGESYTFWLFTHPSGRYVKGEGRTDADALASAIRSLKDTKHSEQTKQT